MASAKYEHLHENDEMAFTELVEEYQEILQNNLNHLDQNQDSTEYYIDYMRSVLAAANALNIEEFEGWAKPSRGRAFEDYDELEYQVKLYVTKVQIRAVRSIKIYSVELSATEKTQIHFFIGRIREVVEEADLEERKKNSLFKKLNAFSADVDKSRTAFGNAYLMGLDVAHLAKEFGEAIKPATDFVRSINELLGAAKAKEPEPVQLPPPPEKLPPPPKRIEGPKSNRDLDDDIPF